MSVPEPDGSICCSSARDKETMLVRRPSQSFDCSIVLVHSVERIHGFGIPNHEFVVIAS